MQDEFLLGKPQELFGNTKDINCGFLEKLATSQVILFQYIVAAYLNYL